MSSDIKAISACKNHSEAERRRRERINNHLSTLRTLLPNSIKRDKATLLEEVVKQVRELKKVASEVLSQKDGDGCWWQFPPESDELLLSYFQSEGELSSSWPSLIRVSLSCDDRPDLMADLTKAMRSVGAKVVKAEFTTIGGRMKSVLAIQSGGSTGGCGGGDGRWSCEDFGRLRRVLQGVLDEGAVSGKASPRLVGAARNKRRRFCEQP